ncbi:hypothetical protein EJB05_48535, partial [Eragrostis curvula]
MDQSRKRAREGDDEAESSAAAAWRRPQQQQQQRPQAAADVAAAEVVDETAPENGGGGVGAEEDEPWQRPPGVFELPWQKHRGGLGLLPGGAHGWDLRDVFFRSLVDGGAATIGVPGDRLHSPASGERALFDGVDAWLAAAADGEVDPFWRSVLEGPRPAA